MSVTFAQIAASTASVTIESGAGPITVIYYPNKITEKAVADMQAGNDANPYMIGLIKSWDVIDGDTGEMFPIERLSDFGIPFKVQLLEAMSDNTRPNLLTPQS